MFIVCCFSLQIPDWWSNGFGVDLPFDDVVNLFDFLDDIRVSSLASVAPTS
jgi:hypothetical protein